MSVTRKTYCLVTVDGRPITQVVSAQSTYGFDQMVSTAEVVTPTVPSWAQYKSVVTIDMGGTQATARRRFTGLLVDYDYTLFPRQVRLLCRGFLFLADLTQNSNSGGTDLSSAGAGATDESMVTTVLNDCGITNLNQIGGTGLTLGTISAADGFTWSEGQSGLDFIRQLDSVCMGYRTFDTFSGSVTRQKIVTSGAPTAGFTFTEGSGSSGDIEKGESQQTMREIRNRVLVTGYNTGTGSGANGEIQVAVRQDSPFLAHDVTEPLNSSMIEQELTGTTPGLVAQDVGTWLVQETNRVVIKTPYTTPRDDLIPPGATVGISPASGRLGMPPTATVGWVQSVTNEYLEDGGYQQTIQLLGGIGSQAPVTTPPRADFSILVETESVVILGSVTTIYVVACQDTSLYYAATPSTYAWSSSGTPSSGSASYYVTEYGSITGQSITLTVTDSNGASNSVTKPIEDTQDHTAAYTRQIFMALTTPGGEAFDGATYRTQADPNSHDTTVVANGPFWGAGVDFLTSTDFMASTPTVTNPFSGGETVTALYVALWVDANHILAGGSSGNIAESTDAGATWSLVTRPSGGAALRVGIDPFSSNHFAALYSGAFWQSQDGGVTWTVLQAAQAAETFRDVVGSFARSMIVMSGGRLMIEQTSGTQQTFPSLSPAVSDIYAVAPHQTEDRFCVIDSSGRTFYHAAAGDTALVQGSDIPAGSAQMRSMSPDGGYGMLDSVRQLAIPGMIYFAVGSGGVWKTLSFFSDSNFYQLRDPGVGTSPVGAVYTMVGTGDFAGQVFTPATIVSSTSCKAKSLWNGSSNNTPPFGWQNVNYDDSGWSAAVIYDLGGHPIGGTADPVWATTTPASSTEQCLVRLTFTLGAGVITTATIKIECDDDYSRGLWINGIWIAGDDGTHTYTVPGGVLQAGTSNVIAVWGANSLPSHAMVCFELDVS